MDESEDLDKDEEQMEKELREQQNQQRRQLNTKSRLSFGSIKADELNLIDDDEDQ